MLVRHGDRLKCRRGCSDCCVDEISVFEIEADRIRTNNGALLREEAPHPAGACAFLDPDGACRIYEDRPYTCRTQGLPLRWLEDAAGGEVVELRDICPLNEEGAPLEELDESDCWTIGPFEGELAEAQKRTSGGLERVRLRELFH